MSSAKKDLSDEVTLTQGMFDLWVAAAKSIIPAWMMQGLDVQQIPDETIERHPEKEGWLIIVVRLKDGRSASLDVPPDQWTWVGRN